MGALVGEFKDGKMVETKPVTLKEAFFEKFDTIMRLRFSLPANGAFRYSYWPSSLNEVHVPPKLEDPTNQNTFMRINPKCQNMQVTAFSPNVMCLPIPPSPFTMGSVSSLGKRRLTRTLATKSLSIGIRNL